MATASVSKRRQKGGDETAVRERILEAAFAAFMKSGYAKTSTLEIATRARVSKRELYALVGNKQEMLIACISERAKRLDVPATPQPPSCNFIRYRWRVCATNKFRRIVVHPSNGRKSIPPDYQPKPDDVTIMARQSCATGLGQDESGCSTSRSRG